MNRFIHNTDFLSLSVSDLLDARDAYHVHLANQPNVVGTAVGKYRIRRKDPDAKRPGKGVKPGLDRPRTLQNTVVQPWSWPCVLVFVQEWQTRQRLAQAPQDYVPPRLYLPDGRVVPTCVVLAPFEPRTPPTPPTVRFPPSLIGGGYPVVTDEQGQERIGSLGCLVTDGHCVYALTNRHVAGEAGTKVFTVLAGERVPVGRTHQRSVGKVSFDEAFRGWHATRAVTNVDAGLIEIDDLQDWTAQVYGVGEVGDPIDLHVDTINLDLIGCPVFAHGGASGPLQGEVQALFYRYRSIGGTDYICDLLIGPRGEDAQVATKPGDSGTIWFWDEEEPRERTADHGTPHAPYRPRQRRPLAIQWGGQSFLDATGEASMQFALATSISTVCRLLDVEVVRDWNIGHREYWGMLGHYEIGAKACGLVEGSLGTLMAKNRDRIGYGDSVLVRGARKPNAGEFTPLADVPDLVWRNTRKKDAPNHFTDMDQPAPKNSDFNGDTLMDVWMKQGTVDRDKWGKFYDAIDLDTADRGALPFRVWQIYDAMVEAVVGHDIPSFVCAAGVLSHYIADACMPLHVSRLHHGRDEGEKGVHETIDKKILDRYPAEVIQRLDRSLAGAALQPPTMGGRAAADAVVGLMHRAINELSPETVIDAYNEMAGRDRIPNMWAKLGDRLIALMAEGTKVLGSVWQSAWEEGQRKGGAIPDADLVAVPEEKLQSLYMNKTFLPAEWLADVPLKEEVERIG